MIRNDHEIIQIYFCGFHTGLDDAAAAAVEDVNG